MAHKTNLHTRAAPVRNVNRVNIWETDNTTINN